MRLQVNFCVGIDMFSSRVVDDIGYQAVFDVKVLTKQTTSSGYQGGLEHSSVTELLIKLVGVMMVFDL